MATFRIVMHVDVDSFYPSVEKRNDPTLEGKPVIVGADPRSSRRGVVASCSYEARKLGVRAGMPISLAYKISPEAVYIRPNFALYSRVSTRVMGLLRDHCDVFEQVSIDEAFLEVTNKAGGDYERVRDLALEIKAKVKREEGLTCSIGISVNKSSAKIASDLQKPDGLTVIPKGKVAEFLSPLPVRMITGVGRKTEEFLSETLGVKTIGDLQKIKGEILLKHFGKTGVWLWGVAHGLEQIEVKERTLMKSLSAEHTFQEDVEFEEALSKVRGELAHTLHNRLMSAGYEYRVISIKIRFSHFQTHTRDNTLPAYTTSKDALIDEAINLMGEFRESSKGGSKSRRRVRLVGVRVADLRKRSSNSDLGDWIPEGL